MKIEGEGVAEEGEEGELQRAHGFCESNKFYLGGLLGALEGLGRARGQLEIERVE